MSIVTDVTVFFQVTCATLRPYIFSVLYLFFVDLFWSAVYDSSGIAMTSYVGFRL